MLTTTDWIFAAKSALGLASDYSIAKHLHIAKTTVSNYQSKKNNLDEETAGKIAEILGINPAIIVASAYHARAKTDAQKQVWQDMYQAVGGLQVEENIRKNLAETPRAA